MVGTRLMSTLFIWAPRWLGSQYKNVWGIFVETTIAYFLPGRLGDYRIYFRTEPAQTVECRATYNFVWSAGTPGPTGVFPSKGSMYTG